LRGSDDGAAGPIRESPKIGPKPASNRPFLIDMGALPGNDFHKVSRTLTGGWK